MYLRGSKVFSKLDLRDGYDQIPITPEDSYKTAFNLRYSAFEFRVMQFGLKNPPAHFQHTINYMFESIADVCVLVYLDDILIFSKTEQERRQHVHAMIIRLDENNFHVK